MSSSSCCRCSAARTSRRAWRRSSKSGRRTSWGADMDVLEAIATTRAIRRFRPDPIPEADLATILFAASRAPSGSNRQLFRFVLLRDDETSRRAKALIGGVARAAWNGKRAHDGAWGGPAPWAVDPPDARFAQAGPPAAGPAPSS